MLNWLIDVILIVLFFCCVLFLNLGGGQKDQGGGGSVCYFFFDFIDLMFSMEIPLFILLLSRILKKERKFWLTMEQGLIFKMMYFDFYLFLLMLLWLFYFFYILFLNLGANLIFLFVVDLLFRMEIPLFMMLLRRVMKKAWKF